MLFFSKQVETECLANPDLYLAWAFRHSHASDEHIQNCLDNEPAELLADRATAEFERFLNLKDRVAVLKNELRVRNNTHQVEQKRIQNQRSELRRKNKEVVHLKHRCCKLRVALRKIELNSSEENIRQQANEARLTDYRSEKVPT